MLITDVGITDPVQAPFRDCLHKVRYFAHRNQLHASGWRARDGPSGPGRPQVFGQYFHYLPH